MSREDELRRAAPVVRLSDIGRRGECMTTVVQRAAERANSVGAGTVTFDVDGARLDGRCTPETCVCGGFPDVG